MDEYELQLHIEFIKNAANAKREYIQKIKNINRDIKTNLELIAKEYSIELASQLAKDIQEITTSPFTILL